jgi:predicted phage-related endonuclease
MSNQQILNQNKTKGYINLPEEALRLIRQYEEAKADENDGEVRKCEAINKLKEILGENETGKIDGYVISSNNVTEEVFDSELFKVENPELYKKYLKESSYQRFSIE